MSKISDKIIELRIATRKATMCENTQNKKNTLSLKTKILYLIRDRNLPPCDIIDALSVAKTNLALIANQMMEEGLLKKNKQTNDKREIFYSITNEGKAYLGKRLKLIEEHFVNVFSTEEEYDEASRKIEDVLNIFSFL